VTTDLIPNTQRYYDSLLLCRLTNTNTWLLTFSAQPFKFQSTHSQPGNYSNQMSTSAPFHITSCISYILKLKVPINSTLLRMVMSTHIQSYDTTLHFYATSFLILFKFIFTSHFNSCKYPIQKFVWECTEYNLPLSMMTVLHCGQYFITWLGLTFCVIYINEIKYHKLNAYKMKTLNWNLIQ
jgi:hypothetical protein